MSQFIRATYAIFWKALRTEWRSREIFSAMFVFALLAIIIFNFAFDLRVQNIRQVVPGVLWVSITFAGMLGLNRSFTVEKENDTLSGLLLAPVDRSALYFGKMAANFLFILSVAVIIVPLTTVFFNVNLVRADLLLVLLAGTFGFAAVGTLFSAITVNTRAQDILLPILLFPVVLPVIIAAVKLTAGLLEQLAVADLANWWRLLIVYDIIFLVIAFLTFEYIVEE